MSAEEGSPTWSLGSGPRGPDGTRAQPPPSRPTAPERPSQRLRISERLGNYVIVRELARGGMGAVYEARHVETAGRYALKTVLAGDLEAIERFRREARLLARLDHPNLVRVHVADLDAARPWFVQDLLEGGSLEARLRRGALPLAEALDVTRAVGAALVHAHSRGVIHRDLKPSNVLFDQDGRPKLVDFGIARHVDATSARLTASGEVLGSPGYMAPEQALGLRDEDERTDVYALAALLYAMVLGQAPFTGTTASEVIDLVVKVPPRPLVTAVPGAPPGLSAVVGKAMSKDPAARPPDVRSFLKALEAAVAAPPPSPGRRRLVVGLAAGAVLAALLAAGALVAHAPPPPVAPPPPPTTSAAPPPPPPSERPPALSPTAPGWSATLVDGVAMDLLWQHGPDGDPPDVLGFSLRQVGGPRPMGSDVEVGLVITRVWFHVNAGTRPFRHDTGAPPDPAAEGAGPLPELVPWLERTVVGARVSVRLDLATGQVNRVSGVPRPPRPEEWTDNHAEARAWQLAGYVSDDMLKRLLEDVLHVFPDRPTTEKRWRLHAVALLPWFGFTGERECEREGARVRAAVKDPRLVGGSADGPGPQATAVTTDTALEGDRVTSSALEVRYKPSSQLAWTNVARATLTVR